MYTQHNTLIGLTSPSSEALYVAPCFHTKSDLRAKFASGSGSVILADSLLGPLSTLPLILDSDIRSITYPHDGFAFRVHSEPSSPVTSVASIDAVLATLERREWGKPYFEEVRNIMPEALNSTMSHDLNHPKARSSAVRSMRSRR